MNLFFCGGIAKSGTTLLQRILNLHDDITCELEDDLNFLLGEFIKIHKSYNSRIKQIGDRIGLKDIKPVSSEIYFNALINIINGIAEERGSDKKFVGISDNNFLLETKADILFSYGYTDEAVKFYKKSLDQYPLNYYAQIRIFENINIENLSNSSTEKIFQNNKQLLYKFFNNKNILLKYIELAQKLNKKEWLSFFNFVLSINKIEKEVFELEIKNFRSTKNKDLLKLVNIIQNIS